MRIIILNLLFLVSNVANALILDANCAATQIEIKTAIEEIKTTEFACLKKMGREDLVKELAPIVDGDLEISCFDDTSFIFGQLAPNAFATLPSDRDFPKIDINQFYDSIVNRSTIFHEMIHLLGYDHDGSTLEMAYACKFACDGSNEDSKRREAAIRICRGDYSSIDDSEYKIDLKKLSDGYNLPSPF